ncbi:Ribonuclease 2 [Dionaea muscipula]
MSSFLVNSTALLYLPIITLLCVFAGINGESTTAQREFDYFVLALQWPGTVCRGTRHCCSSNACCRGSNAPNEFTIHGLWPDYNDGTWPACCSNSRFDIKEISTLRDALDHYWPSLSCGSPKTCHGHKGTFWAHEWEKHGTCSYPVMHDEYDYFKKTLNIYFNYNVSKVLNEAGYVPSNSEKYPLGGLVSAIENAFHTTPLLVCSNGAVEELRLCFYKDFKPRDCASSSISQNSCPNYVSLPVETSLGIGDGERTIPISSGIEAL